MAEITLNVEKRDKVGKQISKQIRRRDKVPGIFYMHGEDSIPVAVDSKQLFNAIRTEGSVVDLSFDNGEKKKCVIREVQWHPIHVRPIHVDLMGIKLTEKIQVEVPIHLTGSAVGVKLHGGILQHILRELPIECLPADIPPHIDVDISNLEIGQAVRVENLKLENIKVLLDPAQAIAVVVPPKLTVEAAPAAEEEITEPEVVGQKKEKEKEEEELKEKEKEKKP
jgi:large subunit ribosomal protein L25